jgi:hypothetical protein
MQQAVCDRPSRLDGFVSALEAAAHALGLALGGGDRLATALRDNCELWRAIGAAVDADDGGLPPQVRVNLRRLADFVIVTSGRPVADLALPRLEGLVTINEQIALRLRPPLREAA